MRKKEHVEELDNSPPYEGEDCPFESGRVQSLNRMPEAGFSVKSGIFSFLNISI